MHPVEWCSRCQNEHAKAPQGTTRHHKATQGTTRQHKATQGTTRQHKATQGNTRQHNATQRNTTQHNATQGTTKYDGTLSAHIAYTPTASAPMSVCLSLSLLCQEKKERKRVWGGEGGGLPFGTFLSPCCFLIFAMTHRMDRCTALRQMRQTLLLLLALLLRCSLLRRPKVLPRRLAAHQSAWQSLGQSQWKTRRSQSLPQSRRQISLEVGLERASGCWTVTTNSR